MKRLQFLQIRQNNFFRAQNNHSQKTPKFERCKDGKFPKLTSSLLKDHQT